MMICKGGSGIDWMQGDLGDDGFKVTAAMIGSVQGFLNLLTQMGQLIESIVDQAMMKCGLIQA